MAAGSPRGFVACLDAKFRGREVGRRVARYRQLLPLAEIVERRFGGSLARRSLLLEGLQHLVVAGAAAQVVGGHGSQHRLDIQADVEELEMRW
jgi:hypothetical protein